MDCGSCNTIYINAGCLDSIHIADVQACVVVPQNLDITDYDFPEDGASIADNLHLGDSNLPASFIDGVERPILAELEGIVMNSPPSAKKVTSSRHSHFPSYYRPNVPLEACSSGVINKWRPQQ